VEIRPKRPKHRVFPRINGGALERGRAHKWWRFLRINGGATHCGIVHIPVGCCVLTTLQKPPPVVCFR
jgi:hypothetical protein